MLRMSDSRRYAEQAELFTCMAEAAATDLERQGYLSLASGYASLAANAARTEARYGAPLTELAGTEELP
jgi:hypothetical protein